MDVLYMTGNDHALEAADPLELAEIKRRWEPYINQLPDYAYLCKDLLNGKCNLSNEVSGAIRCFRHLFCGFFVNLMKKSLTTRFGYAGGGFFYANLSICQKLRQLGGLFVVGREAAGYTDARTKQAGAERAAGTE